MEPMSFREWVRDYFKNNFTNEDYDWIYIPHKNWIINIEANGTVMPEQRYHWVKHLVPQYEEYLVNTKERNKDQPLHDKLNKIIELLENK